MGLKNAFCSILVLAAVSAGLARADDGPGDLPPAPAPQAPPAQAPDDNPFGFVGAGSAEYQHRFGDVIQVGGGNRIEMSFEPTVSFLPARIVIDLDSGAITQADVTLFRAWFISLLSYHRNLDANVASDFEFLRVAFPVFETSAGGEKFLVNLVVRVGGEAGYRWLNDGNAGIYAEPSAGVTLTASILNRIFASAFVHGAAALISQPASPYASGAAGLQLAFGITPDNMLKLAFNASVAYDGANGEAGLPTVSGYLGAGLIWGQPPSFVEGSYQDGDPR